MRSIWKSGNLWACFVVALGFVGAASAQDETFHVAVQADYANPTDRYPHNIMGSLSAHTDLVVTLKPCQNCAENREPIVVRLPENLVFEDFAPRLIDLDLDGRPEIVVVESHQNKGARMAVWEVVGGDGSPALVRGAATDFIGRRFRWLAPIGAADFDRDGSLELAYVETPHLGKTLRIVERDGHRLREIAAVQGVTNHAIGQETVHSRIEVCSGNPVIFALDAGGRQIVSIRMIDGQMRLAVEGPTFVQHHLDYVPLCIN